MKIHKIQGDISKEILNTVKNTCSIDCEMQGLVPRRDQLSLIQLTSDNDNIYIVQPDRKSYEAPNLVSLLNDEKILKIFHFARMDVHFLEYYLKTEVKNYYCTKLMSKLARSYSSNHGLKDLCQELCNVKLEKKYGSSTDWNKSLDDVSEKELKYLCNDVLYLKEIKEKLQKMHQRDNRFDLFLSSMNGVRSRINLDKAGFNDPNIFEH